MSYWIYAEDGAGGYLLVRKGVDVTAAMRMGRYLVERGHISPEMPIPALFEMTSEHSWRTFQEEDERLPALLRQAGLAEWMEAHEDEWWLGYYEGAERALAPAVAWEMMMARRDPDWVYRERTDEEEQALIAEAEEFASDPDWIERVRAG